MRDAMLKRAQDLVVHTVGARETCSRQQVAESPAALDGSEPRNVLQDEEKRPADAYQIKSVLHELPTSVITPASAAKRKG